MPNTLTTKGGGLATAAIQALIDASISDVKQYRVPLPGLMFNVAIDDILGFDSYFSGLGTADFYQGSYRLQSGITAGGKATGYKTVIIKEPLHNWSHKMQMDLYVSYESLADNVMLAYFNWGTKLTEEHFGFQITGGKLQGTCGDGTTQKTVDLVNHGAGAFSAHYHLKSIFYPGVKIDFYINDVLTATTTQNLPYATTNQNQYLYIRSANDTSANNKTVRLYSYTAFVEN